MPVIPAPIFMNLWSFEKKPCANGKTVEFIIHEFKYTPAQGKRKRMQTSKRNNQRQQTENSFVNKRYSTLQQHYQFKGPPPGQKKQFSSKISILRFIHS
jgi:hypothetical protein